MIAGFVMAVVVLAFGGLVGYIALPALAGLLMLIGYRTIKFADLQSTWKTGAVQKAVLATSFLLTIGVSVWSTRCSSPWPCQCCCTRYASRTR